MELFNFIYKNQSLVNSLYAQIFSGLLSSQEDKIESSNQSEHNSCYSNNNLLQNRTSYLRIEGFHKWNAIGI